MHGGSPRERILTTSSNCNPERNSYNSNNKNTTSSTTNNNSLNSSGWVTGSGNNICSTSGIGGTSSPGLAQSPSSSSSSLLLSSSSTTTKLRKSIITSNNHHTYKTPNHRYASHNTTIGTFSNNRRRIGISSSLFSGSVVNPAPSPTSISPSGSSYSTSTTPSSSPNNNSSNNNKNNNQCCRLIIRTRIKRICCKNNNTKFKTSDKKIFLKKVYTQLLDLWNSTMKQQQQVLPTNSSSKKIQQQLFFFPFILTRNSCCCLRKVSSISVVCIVCIIVLLQQQGERALITTQTAMIMTTTSTNPRDTILRSRLRQPTNDGYNNGNNRVTQQQRPHYITYNIHGNTYYSLSSAVEEKEGPDQVDADMSQQQERRKNGRSNDHQDQYHNDHAIPNIITFTHRYNLVTTEFPYSMRSSGNNSSAMQQQQQLTVDEIEMLALQQNVHDIIQLHPSAKIRFLTNKDCVISIRNVMNDMYSNDTIKTTELVNFFQNETEGMYKGDLCRGTALYETGGLYYDVDLGVRMNVFTILNKRTEFVTVKVHEYSPDTGAFFQAFIGIIPKHPVIRRYIDLFYQYYKGTLQDIDNIIFDNRPIGVVLLGRAYDEIQYEQQQEYQQKQQQQLTGMQGRNGHNTRNYNDDDDVNNHIPITVPAPRTHLNQTTELWQETLYSRWTQKFKRNVFKDVPYPTWGMVRACRFVVVAAVRNRNHYYDQRQHNSSLLLLSSPDNADDDNSIDDNSISDSIGVQGNADYVVPFYSRIANSRLCPIARPKNVPMLDWINYILFYR